MALRVLFIGGTGVISSACSQKVIEDGHELFLLTRGKSPRPIPEGAQTILADIRKPESAKDVLKEQKFDVVVNWIGFTPDHIDTDIRLFANNIGQYIFISSASVYAKPPPVPVTESAPVGNPYWGYAQDKLACERRLAQLAHDKNLKYTIVRPSHTYDHTFLPVRGRYTVINRMRTGKKVIVHGDGTSLWTLTYHTDFARGFAGLLGNERAFNETFHITSHELLTWNEIYKILGHAAGVEPQIVHLPSQLIATFDPDWGASLLGDKAHSMVFNNDKIKQVVPQFETKVPFSKGANELLKWFDSDPVRQVVDDTFDRLVDRMITAYESLDPHLQAPRS